MLQCLQNEDCFDQENPEDSYYDKGNTYQHQQMARLILINAKSEGDFLPTQFESLIELESKKINEAMLEVRKSLNPPQLKKLFERSSEEIQAKLLYLGIKENLKIGETTRVPSLKVRLTWSYLFTGVLIEENWMTSSFKKTAILFVDSSM